MDKFKESGSNYKDQAENAHTRIIIDRYKNDYEFRNIVLELAREEIGKSGLTCSLIDACTVANLILYNEAVRRELNIYVDHENKIFKNRG